MERRQGWTPQPIVQPDWEEEAHALLDELMMHVHVDGVVSPGYARIVVKLLQEQMASAYARGHVAGREAGVNSGGD
jgi:hypothetical protein